MSRGTQHRWVGLALGVVYCSGCWSMGPMAGMTFTSAAPLPRTGMEVSVAEVPGFYLSDAVQQPATASPKYGNQLLQVAVLVDPAKALGDLGFSLGARFIANNGGFVEPMVRYRKSFGDSEQVAFGLAASGMYFRYDDPNPPQQVSMLRGGLEGGTEIRVSPPWWVEGRLLAGGGISAVAASGRWCAAADTGKQEACPAAGNPKPVIHASAQGGGPYWSAYGGLAVDFGRPLKGMFHFARLSGVYAVGNMPTVLPVQAQPGITVSKDVQAGQGRDVAWSYWGASITVAFGARAPPKPPAAPVSEQPVGPTPGATGRIVGRVVDDGGRPISGAQLRLEGGATAISDVTGTFQINDVGAGAVQVFIVADGFAPAEEGVSVAPGHDSELQVSLKRGTAPMLAHLKGQVRTTAGDAVPGASINVLELKSSARTDERGLFELHIPAGRYTLKFEAAGFATQTKVLDVSAGDQALFFIDLTRASP